MRIVALFVALLVLGVFVGWLLDHFGDSAGWAVVMIGYACFIAAGFVFYRKAKRRGRGRARHYRDYSIDGGDAGGDGGGD